MSGRGHGPPTGGPQPDEQDADRTASGLTASECADVVLRLFEYVDNEAGPEDRVVIKAHLDACGSCLREYERDLLLKSLVRRACWTETAPHQLRVQILARITTVAVVSPDLPSSD